jgi:murein DD-endopeptidase MepM/ murein hydrolase activator NlpD
MLVRTGLFVSSMALALFAAEARLTQTHGEARRAAEQARPRSQQPLRVTVNARALQPGEVVRLDIETNKAGAAVTDVTATAFGRPLPVTPVGDGHWRALVGIDLDVEAGPHGVTFTLREGGGPRTSQTETLQVEGKTFPTRTLKVDPRFVQPPKAALARIERDRVRLAAVFAKSAPAPLWDHRFIMPVKSSVISSFGVRSVFNGELRQPHGGADLASPAGTPIEAPNAGRVVLAGDLYFTGNTVVIDHGAGLYSLLAHLSKIAVREGDPIDRGALVGAVGATGRVTGPHLHWTVRLGGARVDPVSLVTVLESLAN